jgi:hypothetical protein
MSKIINQLNQVSAFVSLSAFPRMSCSLSTGPRSGRWSRHLTFGLLLAFNFSLLTIQSCGLDVEDPSPPSQPVWVQKSLPDAWPERGIDAHENRGVFLEWRPNPEDNIAGYILYRAEYYEENDSLGKYNLISRVDTETNNILEYLDYTALIRTDYRYTLKAEDNSGNHSEYSESLKYELLPQISANSMTPNGFGDTLENGRQLTWFYNHTFEMEDYILTLLTQQNELVIRTILTPKNYVSGSEIWTIPDDVILESKNIYLWRIDLGAQYIYGLETVGSESAWATFIYSED